MPGNVDVWSNEIISGWAALQNGDQATIEILADGQVVHSVICNQFRRDLREFGRRHGKHAFSINLLQIPTVDAAVITVRIKESNEILRVKESPLVRSQRRWRGSEESRHLTWGVMMTGDSFIEPVEKQLPFGEQARVIEIGPGYGRLLKTVIQRGLTFDTWIGIELSADRVRKLNLEFGSPKIKFMQADVLNSILPKGDIVLCSSTLEHLYPDCSLALKAIRDCLYPRGLAVLDFVDPAQFAQGASFDPGSGTYVRCYSAAEIKALFANAGLREIQSNQISFGRSAEGYEVLRLQYLVASQ